MRAKHKHTTILRKPIQMLLFSAANFVPVRKIPRRDGKTNTRISHLRIDCVGSPAVKTRRGSSLASQLQPFKACAFVYAHSQLIATGGAHSLTSPKKAAARLVFPWPSLGTGDASVQYGGSTPRWGGPLRRHQVAVSRNIKTHPRTYRQLFTHVSQQHEGVHCRSLSRPRGLRPRTGALPDSW
jgi:hypothetical protein